MDPSRVHVFRDSGYTTLMTGRKICAACGFLEADKVHSMPPTPEAAREIDARIVGERV